MRLFFPDENSRFLIPGRGLGPAGPSGMLRGRMQEKLNLSPRMVLKEWEKGRDVSITLLLSPYYKGNIYSLKKIRKYG